MRQRAREVVTLTSGERNTTYDKLILEEQSRAATKGSQVIIRNWEEEDGMENRARSLLPSLVALVIVLAISILTSFYFVILWFVQSLVNSIGCFFWLVSSISISISF